MYTPAPSSFIRIGSNLVRADDIRQVGIREASPTTATLIVEFYGDSSTVSPLCVSPLCVSIQPQFRHEILNYCQGALAGATQGRVAATAAWNPNWEADNTDASPAPDTLDQKHQPEAPAWYIRPGHRIRYQDYVAKSWVPGNVISFDAETQSAKIQCPSIDGGKVFWSGFGRIGPVEEDLPPAHIFPGNQVRYRTLLDDGWILAIIKSVDPENQEAKVEFGNQCFRYLTFKEIFPVMETPPAHIFRGNQVRFFKKDGSWILAKVATTNLNDSSAHLIYDDGYGPFVPFEDIYPVRDSATRENTTIDEAVTWIDKKVLVLGKNPPYILAEGTVQATVKYHDGCANPRCYVRVEFSGAGCTTTREEMPLSNVYAVLDQPQAHATTV